MLLYLGHGPRDFRRDPRPPGVRRRWEILAVLAGRCAPIFPERALAPQAATLWLLPPESCHGWHADGRPCRVLVLHAAVVPEPWAAAARSAGLLCARLDAAGLARLDGLGRRLAMGGGDPRANDMLERLALAEVALLLLSALGPPPLPSPAAAADRLAAALAWFEEHMAQSPDGRALAAAVGLGPAQLRRICKATHGRRLGALLEERRLERARALLAQPDMGIAGIARACGWRSAGALSHAVRRRERCTASELRQRLAGD